MRRTVLALLGLLLPAAALAQSNAGGGGGGGGTASSVSVTNFPATQATSLSSLPAFAQTPTFNLGTLNGAALDASLQAIKTALGSPLQAGGAVSVSNLPASQAVTGTFWQATQPVSGTFWQATQPVSAAALPLPSGAATAANQSSEVAALGAPGDAAYGGSGSASLVATMKGVYAVNSGRSIWAVDSTLSASIANGSTTGGTIRGTGGVTGGAASPYTWFRVNARADQAVVLLILGSDDGFSTFDTVYSQTLTANTTVQAQVPLFYTSYRAAIQNTTGASSAVKVRTSFTTN